MSMSALDRSWVDMAAAKLGPPVFTNSEEVRFNCFRRECGTSGEKDSHFHMYVNPTKGKFFCQRCQKGGTLEYLTQLLGIPLPEQNMSAWTSVIQEFLWPSKTTEKVDESVPPIEYPPAVPFFAGMQSLAYVRSRGISDEQIGFYNIRAGADRLRGRVVFPDENEKGDLIYWVARDYVGREPKYKNATSPRRYMVYNAGRIKQWFTCLERVIVCEGVISGIAAGYNAVATYGKYVTTEQLHVIKSIDADEVVVAFDGDAIEYAVSLATRLRKIGCRTRIAKFPIDKDPGDLGSESRRYIDNAIEVQDDFDAVQVMLQ